jgi:uncharacterized membrane-anchored protein
VRRRLFLVGVLVHAAVLAGWAGSLEWARARAPVIRLETAPVDPRDLLRGDYIHLRYMISAVPENAFLASARPERAGEPVYVALAPRGPVHEVVAASRTREALPLGPGHRLLVGTAGWITPGRPVTVEYGIERYYVREGAGRRPPAAGLQAEVAVTAAGRPYLLRLLLDGRPYP